MRALIPCLFLAPLFALLPGCTPNKDSTAFSPPTPAIINVQPLPIPSAGGTVERAHSYSMPNGY